MSRVAGTVNIFTIPWGGIEVNGKERKTSEKGKCRNLKLIIKKQEYKKKELW